MRKTALIALLLAGTAPVAHAATPPDTATAVAGKTDKSDGAQSGDVKAGDTKSGEAKPGDTKSGETKPAKPVKTAQAGDATPDRPTNAESPRPTETERPGRRRGYVAPPPFTLNDGGVWAPPPEAFPTDQIPIPDRWRLIDALGDGPIGNWYDPYNQNALKADRPIWGTQDWFFNLTGISDTVLEPRSFPLPVGVQTTERPGSLDTFGHTDSFAVSQTFIASASLIQGSTAYKPPSLEIRLTLADNLNYVTVPERRILSVKPSRDTERVQNFLGVQEAFVDYHIRDVSDRYDFDSVRVGIQPFSSDFRGFLFQDNQLGVRLFGDRDDNRWQYNVAFFDLLEKDTNSGLNSLTQSPRNDYVFAANLYRQDLPVPGFTSQLTVIYNMDRESGEIHVDKNGFPVRPALIGDLEARDYDVVYLGYNGDGHIGDFNLTASSYLALGEDRNNIFTGKPADIRSYFFAAEPSYDLDWVRVRLSALYASGDDNPYDNTESGFDSIEENPQIAGADTSYWIRQSIPFIGGGRAVSINGRNGVLNDLRSSKDEGQSNFNNPGTGLLGVGGDFDILPELRMSANINHLWFVDTQIVEALRQEGSVDSDLGWDYSLAATYRPFDTQNVVFRASGAVFDPGSGFGRLFDKTQDERFYSMLFNLVLTY